MEKMKKTSKKLDLKSISAALKGAALKSRMSEMGKSSKKFKITPMKSGSKAMNKTTHGAANYSVPTSHSTEKEFKSKHGSQKFKDNPRSTTSKALNKTIHGSKKLNVPTSRSTERDMEGLGSRIKTMKKLKKGY